MKQENKELLLIDLSARLPYEVICHIRYESGEPCYDKLTPLDIKLFLNSNIESIRPYLRPLSSMTEEEKEEFDRLINLVEERCINAYGKGGYTLAFTELNDWLNKHYFDYRCLIRKGLALEAPEGIYNIK